MKRGEAGALSRLKRFLSESPRIIRGRNQIPRTQSCSGLRFFFNPMEHDRISVDSLRLDLADEKDLARALSLGQTPPVKAKKAWLI
jgi:hypothetical protein